MVSLPSSRRHLIIITKKVPASSVLGEVGKGYKIAIETLNEGRIGIGIQSLCPPPPKKSSSKLRTVCVVFFSFFLFLFSFFFSFNASLKVPRCLDWPKVSLITQ